MLLMHGFGTLHTLVPCHYTLPRLISLLFLYMAWPWSTNINENFLAPVDYEIATTYSTLMFVNLGEYFVELMQ